MSNVFSFDENSGRRKIENLQCQGSINSYWCMSLLFVVGPLFQSLSSLILQDQLNSAPHHPSHCSAASTCKLYPRPTLQTEHLILSTVSGEKLRQRGQYSSIKPQRDCQNCLDYANKISLCCPQYRTLELFKHAQSPSMVETWQLIK